jgi:hypothetical protein
MAEDRRLSGVRIPRFVNLDGPEASARIRSVVEHFRERYPDAGTPQAWERAKKAALEIERIRAEGFSAAERADLLAWLETLP